MATKQTRWPTAAELDLESRLKLEAQQALHLVSEAPFVTETVAPYAGKQDVSGYIGVSQEYQNYANDTEKPLNSSEGVEGKATDAYLAQFDTSNTSVEVEASNDGQPDDEEKKSGAGKTVTPPGPPAPPAA